MVENAFPNTCYLQAKFKIKIERTGENSIDVIRKIITAITSIWPWILFVMGLIGIK